MRYSFSVCQKQVEDHVFWAASSSVLEGCVGQGETAIEAVRELEINEIIWINTAKKYGISVPDAKPIQPEPMTWEAYKEHVKCVDPESGYYLTKIEAAIHYAGLNTVDDLIRLVSDLRAENASTSDAEKPSNQSDNTMDLSDIDPEMKAAILRNDALLRLRDKERGVSSDD